MKRIGIRKSDTIEAGGANFNAHVAGRAHPHHALRRGGCTCVRCGDQRHLARRQRKGVHPEPGGLAAVGVPADRASERAMETQREKEARNDTW